MHIDRVASRVEQGGHWIAEEDIRFRYGQPLQNLKPALDIAYQVIIIDNTYVPSIIAEMVHGKLIFCVESIPAWSENAIIEYR